MRILRFSFVRKILLWIPTLSFGSRRRHRAPRLQPYSCRTGNRRCMPDLWQPMDFGWRVACIWIQCPCVSIKFASQYHTKASIRSWRIWVFFGNRKRYRKKVLTSYLAESISAKNSRGSSSVAASTFTPRSIRSPLYNNYIYRMMIVCVDL